MLHCAKGGGFRGFVHCANGVWLAVAPDDSTPGRVICGDFDVDQVSGEDPNTAPPAHLPGWFGEQLKTAVELHLECRVGEHLDDGPAHPDIFFFVLGHVSFSNSRETIGDQRSLGELAVGLTSRLCQNLLDLANYSLRLIDPALVAGQIASAQGVLGFLESFVRLNH